MLQGTKLHEDVEISAKDIPSWTVTNGKITVVARFNNNRRIES